MDLHTITGKGVKHAHKFRVGRGLGSGSGKTAGRGHKGWGARSGAFRRPGYEGGQMPIYRRVPKRGFTNAPFRIEYTVINVDDLNVFEDGATVDLDAVLARGLTSIETRNFKVLGNGALERRLTVRAQKFSKSAAQKIQAAGGAVIRLDGRGRELPAEAPEATAPAPGRAAKAAGAKAAAAKAAGPEPTDAKPPPAKPSKKPKPAKPAGEATPPGTEKP